jgi:predicted dehydrogenase
MNQEYSSYGEFLKLSICEGDTCIPKVKFEEPLTVQNRHFIECIQNGKQPLSDGKFAVSVVKALEGVMQSLKYTEGVKIC